MPLAWQGNKRGMQINGSVRVRGAREHNLKDVDVGAAHPLETKVAKILAP